jgi:hypothetical protein
MLSTPVRLAIEIRLGEGVEPGHNRIVQIHIYR